MDAWRLAHLLEPLKAASGRCAASIGALPEGSGRFRWLRHWPESHARYPSRPRQSTDRIFASCGLVDALCRPTRNGRNFAALLQSPGESDLWPVGIEHEPSLPRAAPLAPVSRTLHRIRAPRWTFTGGRDCVLETPKSRRMSRPARIAGINHDADVTAFMSKSTLAVSPLIRNLQ
jgi:hypothetical protein